MAKTNKSSSVSAVGKTQNRVSTKTNGKEKEMVKKNHMENNNMNTVIFIEDEINDLIESSDSPVETSIFAAKYCAFRHGYQTFQAWSGTGFGEAADREYLRGMLPYVEALTDKLNFLAKAVAGYRANIVQRIEADAAAEVEENWQLHAIITVQLAAINNAYGELAWAVDNACVHIIEAIHDHSRDKTVSDSPKAA